jgi:hypothetical protein
MLSSINLSRAATAGIVLTHVCPTQPPPYYNLSLSPSLLLTNERFSRPLLTTPVLPLSFQRSSPCRSVGSRPCIFFLFLIYSESSNFDLWLINMHRSIFCFAISFLCNLKALLLAINYFFGLFVCVVSKDIFVCLVTEILDFHY